MQMDEGTVHSSDEKLLDNLNKYRVIRSRSLHKMNPIPVFKK
jgi:hypothetical protein